MRSYYSAQMPITEQPLKNSIRTKMERLEPFCLHIMHSLILNEAFSTLMRLREKGFVFLHGYIKCVKTPRVWQLCFVNLQSYPSVLEEKIPLMSIMVVDCRLRFQVIIIIIIILIYFFKVFDAFYNCY